MRSSSLPKPWARKSAAVLASLVAILGASATVFAATSAPATPARVGYDADPYRQVNITSQAAIESVRQIAGVTQTPLGSHNAVQVTNTSDLVATGPFDGALFRYYKVSGSGVQATVDVNDGHVSQLLLLQQMPKSSCSTSLTADQADAVASSFLASRSVSTDGLTASVSAKNGGDVQSFDVSWQRVVNGVEVPDSRLVELDACQGIVFNMYNIRRPYSAPPTPLVGHDQASSLAEHAVQALVSPTGSGVQPLVPFKLVDARLQLGFDAAGAQQLLWSIQLGADGGHGYSNYYFVTVDAMSGSAAVSDVGM
jgi:hypothetical protein